MAGQHIIKTGSLLRRLGLCYLLIENLLETNTFVLLRRLLRFTHTNARLIISGGAKSSRPVSLSLSHSLSLFPSLCVCALLCTEKNETLQPPLRPSCSDAASDFTPCQTPRCPALREQRQLLNPPLTGHAGAGANKMPLTRTHRHTHTLHALPLLPHT